MGRVSRAAWIYIAAVVVAAASVVAPSLSGPPMGTGWWLSLGVLMLLFLICDSAPTPLAARQSAWSPSSSATLAAVVLLGPVGAALVGAVSVLGLRRKLQAVQVCRSDLQRLPRQHGRRGVIYGRDNRIRSRRNIANLEAAVPMHLRAIQHQTEIF